MTIELRGLVRKHTTQARLQREEVDGFATSWHALPKRISEKRSAPGQPR